MFVFPSKTSGFRDGSILLSKKRITENAILFDGLTMRLNGGPESADELIGVISVLALALPIHYKQLQPTRMGPTQICMNVPRQEEGQVDRPNSHAPNPDIFPEVGDDPSSLPCGINHMRQELSGRILLAPEDYKPAPYSKDSFFELVKDTAYYRGEWSQGYPCGLGEVIFRDRSYFRGYLKDMQARGPECLFVLADGAYYIGGVSHSKRDGMGTFTDHGYIYQGEWLNNLPHGKATEKFANGDRFQGKFVQGLRSGPGVYTWAKGPYSLFDGIFDYNMFGKKGKLMLRDGTVVQGQFSCDSAFDISLCTITSKQYKLTDCEVADGRIQQFQFERGEFKVKEGTLSRKKVIFREKGRSEETINAIIKEIQRGYQHVRKHSEALRNIREGLPNYHCGWWEEGQNEGAILIVEICGKKICICKKN